MKTRTENVSMIAETLKWSNLLEISEDFLKVRHKTEDNNDLSTGATMLNLLPLMKLKS